MKIVKIDKKSNTIWNSMKYNVNICEKHTNQYNTMKVLRRQEDSLESSTRAVNPFLRPARFSNTHALKSMQINANLWKSWNTMKVFRGQEDSLESSKGFYRGSKLFLTGGNTHAPKSMEIHQTKSMKIYKNLWKSMEIHEIRWKSSED